MNTKKNYNKLFKESDIGKEYYEWALNNKEESLNPKTYNKYYQRFYFKTNKKTDKYKSMKKENHIKYYKKTTKDPVMVEKHRQRALEFAKKKLDKIQKGETFHCKGCGKHYLTENGYKKHISKH